MSFQHFRLQGSGTLVSSIPGTSQMALPPILPSPAASSSIAHANIDPTLHTTHQFQVQLQNSPPSTSSKAPYGSGDADDGYTMLFENLDAFHAWRLKEEEEKIVEFVKGDTHGSKAVPPRFKDHTKLVCARHQRSGRKKYVKKHPERVRKVPSRKIEGAGCPAAISFKTYFDTEEVRVCYQSHHSHEIGLANLPFTRRGRKAQAQADKGKKGRRGRPPNSAKVGATGSTASPPISNAMTGISMFRANTQIQASSPPLHARPPPHPSGYNQAVSMIAPLPQLAMGASGPSSQTDRERWDRMGTLFASVKEHAKAHQFPEVSVAALESVLIRLYLESPIGLVNPMVPAAVAAPPLASGQINQNQLDEEDGAPMDGIIDGMGEPDEEEEEEEMEEDG